MEELLKRELNTNVLTRTGKSGGGCINDGESYDTDHGRIFVKSNIKDGARIMFDGEYEGLLALCKTETVRVPKPIKVFDLSDGGGSALAMEDVEMRSLGKYQAKLGEKMAKLHKYNNKMMQKAEKESSTVGAQDNNEEDKYVTQFGFHTTTCCGYLPMVNEWKDDWVSFYASQRLQPQIEKLINEYHDSELQDLWSQLGRKLPRIFHGVKVTPALLHGDLWGGNVAEASGGPVIFDPATYYGHSEFEFGIAMMFGGFTDAFFTAYHNILPKQSGYHTRIDLYKLFHYLNHWNHFGSGYRGQSISLMRGLLQ